MLSLPEDKLAQLEKRFDSVEAALAAGPSAEGIVRLSKEYAELEPVVRPILAWRKAAAELRSAEELAGFGRPGNGGDGGGRDRASSSRKVAAMEQEIRILLLPQGRGGREERHSRSARRHRRRRGGAVRRRSAAHVPALCRPARLEVRADGGKPDGEAGGYKEVIAKISGKGAYARLKYEIGVHRVQRVPATEAQGRIHTSAATVAVLPEVEDIDIEIRPEDIRIDTMRVVGRRRPARQHHQFGGAHHASADRHRRHLVAEEPAPEPRAGDGRAARPALRGAAQCPRYRALRGAARAGRQRRSLGAHPHLQFPAGAGDRPPHQPDALQARQGDRRRRARRADRGADHREPGGAAGRDGDGAADATTPIGLAWRQVRDRFRAAGIDTAELDARLLAQQRARDRRDGAGAARARGDASPTPRRGSTSSPSGGWRASRSAASWAKRNSGACGFAVNEATLVPRPETETAGAAKRSAFLETRKGQRFLDLGTGSGAIAVSIAVRAVARRPGLPPTSRPPRIEAARTNAERHGVAEPGRVPAGELVAGGAAHRAVRPDRLQSALHRRPTQIDELQPGGPDFRPAIRRSTAVGTGSRPTAPLRRRRRAG